MTDKELVEAYRIVLKDVARWRREAVEHPDPAEFERRDWFLLKLESIAFDAIPGRGMVAPAG